MQHLVQALAAYAAETRKLEGMPSSTETTFYPDLKLLLTAVLKNERLPFDVITGTSEAGARRRDMPDFVLGDSSLFVGVYGEVKRADTSLDDLAVSTAQNDQIGRYLAQTGVVLLCNVRGIGLLTCDPSFARDRRTPVPPARRVLEKTVDLWSAVGGSINREPLSTSSVYYAKVIIAGLIDLFTKAIRERRSGELVSVTSWRR